MLSQQAIMEYQKLYKQTFGKEISYEKALEEGTRLVDLVRVVYFPKRLTKLGVYGQKRITG